MTNQVFGGKELEAALKQLPKATAKNVLRRALQRAAEPIVSAAEANAPHGQTGELKASEIASTRISRRQKSSAPKSGVTVFVGPSGLWGSLAHLIEFGTSKAPAHPFLRPAWDENKDKVRSMIADEIWKALAKAARTLARKAERGNLSKAARRALTGSD